MQEENYFERQKELMALKEQLRVMKNRERLNDLHYKMQTLDRLRTELIENLSLIRNNMEYVNENMKTVEPLLKSDTKINMMYSCAANFKSIVESMSVLSNYVNGSVHTQETHLNVDSEKLIEDITRSISDCKSDIQYTTLLLSNMQKLTNFNFSIEKQQNNCLTENIRPSSSIDSNETTHGMITFSEAIASSPLQN